VPRLRGDLAAILTFASGKKNPDFQKEEALLDMLLGQTRGPERKKAPDEQGLSAIAGIVGCGGKQLPIPTFVGGSYLSNVQRKIPSHLPENQRGSQYTTAVTKTAKNCLQALGLASQSATACTTHTVKLESKKGGKQPFAVHHVNVWFGAEGRLTRFENPETNISR